MQRTHRKALRRLIDQSNKTQEQFARDNNLDPGQLSRLLAGKERIGGRLAMRLQSITGIDAREFLSEVRS